MRNTLAATLALLLCAALPCPAQELTTISEPAASLNYHLRLEPPRLTSASLTLYWNYSDSANYMAATLDIPPAGADDPLTGFSTDYRIVARRNGADSLCTAGTMRSQYPSGKNAGFSAVLSADATGASLCLGAQSIDTYIAVPFDRATPGAIGYSCSRNLRELRNNIRLTPLRTLAPCPITDIDSLQSHLARSTDPREGFWAYLDRDTDPAKAALGGFYTLATVADSTTGAYSIVYIDGSRAAASEWRAMDLKGRLHPTIFKGHFDLVWVEPDGNVLSEELNADFDENNSILTLRFPLHKASVRFRKIPK